MEDVVKRIKEFSLLQPRDPSVFYSNCVSSTREGETLKTLVKMGKCRVLAVLSPSLSEETATGW